MRGVIEDRDNGAAGRVRKRPDARPEQPGQAALDDLIAAITDDNCHDAIEKGPAVGREVW